MTTNGERKNEDVSEGFRKEYEQRLENLNVAVESLRICVVFFAFSSKRKNDYDATELAIRKFVLSESLFDNALQNIPEEPPISEAELHRFSKMVGPKILDTLKRLDETSRVYELYKDGCYDIKGISRFVKDLKFTW